MNKLTVGQTIFYQGGLGRSRSDKELKETVITKVGRKYFELESLYRCKFDINTLDEVSEFSSSIKLYLSKEAYDDEVKSNKLIRDIRDKLGSYGSTNIPLFKLEMIMNILES